MLKPYAKVLWWLNVAALIAAIVLYPSSGLGIDFYPLLVFVPLLMVALFGELGWYPFQGPWYVQHRFAFYFYLLVITAPANGLAKSPTAPSWYPTDSPYWLVIPWLGAGALFHWRGLRVREWFPGGFFRLLHKPREKAASDKDSNASL